MKKKFIHHVMFWLKNPKSTTEYNLLMEGIKSLEKIKSISDIHIGKPAKTRREVIDSTYDFSLLIIFDNSKKHDEYQIDLIHKNFVESCNHLWKKVLIFDSED